MLVKAILPQMRVTPGWASLWLSMTLRPPTAFSLRRCRPAVLTPLNPSLVINHCKAVPWLVNQELALSHAARVSATTQQSSRIRTVSINLSLWIITVLYGLKTPKNTESPRGHGGRGWAVQRLTSNSLGRGTSWNWGSGSLSTYWPSRGRVWWIFSWCALCFN